MRFGAHYLPTYVPELDGSFADFYRSMFEQIEELDRLGFHDVWITEHHFSHYGGTVPHPPTFLSAAARTTRRIRLGVALSVLPLHRPLDVAESYAMADVISNGRLEFGVGRGNEPIEFKKLGLSQETSGRHVREAIEVIRQAWSDDPVDFSGELFEYHGVNVFPKPVQRPHPPLWAGARSEETFHWAGENGFHLMTLPYMSPSAEAMREGFRIYREAQARAGHGKRDILGKFHVYVSDSWEQAVREATPYLDNYQKTHRAADPSRKLRNRVDMNSQADEGFIIAGDPQRCIDAIRYWREEVGLTTLSGTFHFGGLPQELAMKNIRMFAERVMPSFEKESGA